jgi:hypothetical protein
MAMVSVAAPPLDTASVVQAHEKMLKEVRSWGYVSLGLGALHLISSGFTGLSAPWGVLLIAIGLTSFYFKEAAMFVIYGTTLGWAALTNIMGNVRGGQILRLRSVQVGWVGFGMLQVYFAFVTFRQYFRFRQAEADYTRLVKGMPVGAPGELALTRAGRAFPLLRLRSVQVTGCLLGGLSLGSIVPILRLRSVQVFVGMVLAMNANVNRQIPDYFDFLIGMIVNLGVLGVAVGLASLLARHRYRVLAILGMIAGALVMALWIIMVLS